MTRKLYLASLRALLSCIFDGICDSLRLPSTLVFFLSSVTVRVRTAQCFVLNGVIFLGSILLADFIMAPLLRAVLALGGMGSSSDSSSDASTSLGVSMPLASASIPLPSSTAEHPLFEWINVLFLYSYQLLWIYPLYAMSFILNAIYYQDIADHAFVTHGASTNSTQQAPKSLTFQKWIATMSDEVYRLLLVTAYMLQLTLVSFIPFGIGNVLVLCHLCWMYSLYSFEYKWSLLGWSLEYRLKYFERNYAYFLGFGMPAVAVSMVFPKFISLGIFALVFPIFIILAIIAHPTSHVKKLTRQALPASASANVTSTNKGDAVHRRDSLTKPSSTVSSTSAAPTQPISATSVWLPQLPIFRFATLLNFWLLRQLQRRTKVATTTRRPSLDATSTLAEKLAGKPPPVALAAATNGVSAAHAR